MKIKSFFAESVEAAMQAAHREFGPDAVLVTSRRAGPQNLHLGKYEVVAGTVDGAAAPAPPVGRGRMTEIVASSSDGLGNQIADLKKQIEGLRDFISRADHVAGVATGVDARNETLRASLITQDMDPQVAAAIVQQVAPDEEGPAAAWRALESRIATDSSLGRGATGPHVVALVGPPGAGKTTTLVKLAIRHGLEKLRQVHLLSADPIRIGASAQLKSFAAILGVKFQHFDTAGSLIASLSGFRETDLLLIDTPGLSASNVAVGRDLATVLSRHLKIDVHLVLPASMRRKDMQTAIALYQPFGARRLIFTRLDETESYGAMAGESIRTGMPVSFLTCGPQIPEDIEDASPGRIARLVTGDAKLSFAPAA